MPKMIAWGKRWREMESKDQHVDQTNKTEEMNKASEMMNTWTRARVNEIWRVRVRTASSHCNEAESG